MTESVYMRQSEELRNYCTILQNNLGLGMENKEGITLDGYVNLIYKDIYVRYLISKGIGV